VIRYLLVQLDYVIGIGGRIPDEFANALIAGEQFQAFLIFFQTLLQHAGNAPGHQRQLVLHLVHGIFPGKKHRQYTQAQNRDQRGGQVTAEQPKINAACPKWFHSAFPPRFFERNRHLNDRFHYYSTKSGNS